MQPLTARHHLPLSAPELCTQLGDDVLAAGASPRAAKCVSAVACCASRQLRRGEGELHFASAFDTASAPVQRWVAPDRPKTP